MRCKNCTSNDKSQRGGTRYMPFAFTEQGVAMLSGVLKSDTAIEVNIKIMRAFIAMRSFMMNMSKFYNDVKKQGEQIDGLQKTVTNHTTRIETLETKAKATPPHQVPMRPAEIKVVIPEDIARKSDIDNAVTRIVENCKATYSRRCQARTTRRVRIIATPPREASASLGGNV